ncbi:MAG TPA: hypothetical protein QGF95_06485 [Candidatus Latescibacteria bacterium]|jgi:hypothetical protein|nr:hypothetical protein [Gemmatimonadaceae bacterium]MDP6018865.1 hypothetical protein [Candidatus Latescibacterota bacterium]HJP30183.1 hypothetical protein [Candidatus Latescibacterota bacterium]
MAYRRLDTDSVRVQPLAERRSKHALADILVDPDGPATESGAMAPIIDRVASAVRAAREADASVILCYGAHLVKNGLGPVVERLLEYGWVTHLATNGAGVIHDWEYAFGGRSEEDVRRNVAAGTFGAWDETGRYTQLALLAGALEGMGYGESLGRFINEEGCTLPEPSRLQQDLVDWATQPDGDEAAPARAELLRAMSAFGWSGGRQHVPHPHRDHSLTAAAWRHGVPLTVHPGIGYDIVFVHPMARGAVLGRAAGIDFGVFAQSVSGLQSGVLLSVGSAIMAPQVFEKAASVANNLRLQRTLEPISPFIAVNDLAPMDWDWSAGEPPMDNPAYYLRFCKSFHRLATDLAYAAGDNRAFLGGLWNQLRS